MLWDLDNLTPFVQGDWAINAGPRLPLEFSLVSRKRLGALALAIDEKHGAYSPSSIILSMHSDIIEARSNLAARERTKLDGIGFIDLEHQSHYSISLTTKTLISSWLEHSGLRGVVWTDSPPNFENHTNQPFSVENAKRYLHSLSEPFNDEGVLDYKRVDLWLQKFRLNLFLGEAVVETGLRSYFSYVSY